MSIQQEETSSSETVNPDTLKTVFVIDIASGTLRSSLGRDKFHTKS